MTCLFSSKYTSTADIYSRTSTVTPSGQIKYTWNKTKTIDCLTVNILNSGIKSVSVSEDFGADYEPTDYVFIMTKIPLNRSQRITNIRNKKDNKILWAEEELKNSPATVFNANGSMPILDPFGNIIEYKTFLSRAEVQDVVSS